MDINTKMRMALENFEMRNGIYPNRIIMGYYLAKELAFSIGNYNFPKSEKLKYGDIPVEINYYSPNALSVGYMEDWFETNVGGEILE